MAAQPRKREHWTASEGSNGCGSNQATDGSTQLCVEGDNFPATAPSEEREAGRFPGHGTTETAQEVGCMCPARS